jgi:hypothetical protein
MGWIGEQARGVQSKARAPRAARKQARVDRVRRRAEAEAHFVEMKRTIGGAEKHVRGSGGT